MSSGATKCDNSENHKKWNEIIEKSFTRIKSVQPYYTGGIKLPNYYKNIENDIINFDVNEKDVFINGFSKSGTTWSQEMVWMITNNLDFEGAKQTLNKRSHYFELGMFDTGNAELKNLINLDESATNILQKRKFTNHPCNIKSHLPFNLLPKQIQDGTKKPKIIYVIRNPKDVCVSYYHHAVLFEGYIGSFTQFCHLFLAGELTYTPYWTNIFSYWNQRHRSNILILRYEDMKRDLPSIIRQVATFLEKSLSEDQVNILTKHLSFEVMKKNPAVNFSKTIEILNKIDPNQPRGEFIRSGTVGDYKNLMTPEIVNEFNQWIDLHTKDTEFKVYSV